MCIRDSHDSLAALNGFSQQLRPRTRVFTKEDGTSELLLCLYGSFELNDSSSIPAIPILIWIPKQYPLVPPIPYIDLANLNSNKIRIGEHIDSEGKIYLPIFQHWDPRSCNISKMLIELLQIGSREHFIQPTQSSSPNGQNDNTKNVDIKMQDVRPPLPPKPTLLMKNGPTSSSTSSLSTHTDNMRFPVSPSPSRQQSQLSSNTPLPPKIPLNNSSISIPISPPKIPKRPTEPKLETSFDLLDLTTSGETHEDSTHKKTMIDLQETINALSQADKTYIDSELQGRVGTIESAFQQFEDLYAYETKYISSVKQSIEENKDKLRRETEVVKNEIQNVRNFGNKHLEKGTTDPLWMVSTESAGLNQLYDLVAKDDALSDTINALYQMLNRGVIALDLFVRKSRELAREQFLTRLHIEKITTILLEAEH